MIEALRAFSEVFLPIVIIAAVGYALQASLPLDMRSLNRVSLYALSPALLFVPLLRTEIPGDEAVRLAALMALVVFAMSAIAWAIASLLRLSGPQRGGFMLATTFMNSGNYGLPATRFAFGDVGFQYAVVGYLTQSFFSQTYAVYVASAGGGSRRAALLQVSRMPMIYAGLAAVVLRLLGLQLDEADGPVALGLFRGLRLLGDATLPFLLLILGMQLRRRQVRSPGRILGTAVLLRLLVSIPLAAAIGLALGLDDLPLRVGIVQAAMPTAVNTTILALEFDAWPAFVSSAVIATTLGSLLTLTLLIAFLR